MPEHKPHTCIESSAFGMDQYANPISYFSPTHPHPSAPLRLALNPSRSSLVVTTAVVVETSSAARTLLTPSLWTRRLASTLRAPLSAPATHATPTTAHGATAETLAPTASTAEKPRPCLLVFPSGRTTSPPSRPRLPQALPRASDTLSGARSDRRLLPTPPDYL